MINSLAHYIGEQYYTTEVSARGNFILALFTNGIVICLSQLISGEGNHNFHHSFPSDFRNGYRKTDWDPTKWIIFLIHKYTTQIPSIRRTPDSEVERARRRVLMDHSHCTRPQITKFKDLPSIPAREIKEKFRGRPVIVLDGVCC